MNILMKLILSIFLIHQSVCAKMIDGRKQKEVVVFKSRSGKKNIYYRIPSLVTLNSQKIIFAFAEERVANKNKDSGNINIVYKYSRNHGKSWSRPYLVCSYKGTDGKEGTCGNPTVTVDQKRGLFHIFMNTNNGHKKQIDPVHSRDRIRRGDRKIFYMRGKFDLKKRKLVWSKTTRGSSRINLTNKLQVKYKEAFDLVGPGTGIVFDNKKSKRHGRIMVPAAQRIFYTDNGHTKYLDKISWKESDIFERKKSSETAIVQLPNKDIYRNDRMHGQYRSGPYCGSNKPELACKTRRMVSIIKNVGTVAQTPVYDQRLLDPPAQGSLLRYTDKNIMFSNCSSSRRKFLTIRRSNGTLGKSNDARTLHFDRDYIRVDNDCGYSSMSKTRDYKIGILYEKKALDKKLHKVTKTVGGKKSSVHPKDLVFKKFPLNLFK